MHQRSPDQCLVLPGVAGDLAPEAPAPGGIAFTPAVFIFTSWNTVSGGAAPAATGWFAWRWAMTTGAGFCGAPGFERVSGPSLTRAGGGAGQHGGAAPQ
ncbi:MAG TPA: hypothetical protein VFJ58_25555 [Armatimonadota bacterium]|nr:hypothetical protein [Armatimonadota bacterium]